MRRDRECYLRIERFAGGLSAIPRQTQTVTAASAGGMLISVGSGVMGSDGFESKKLGQSPGGAAAPGRLGSGFSAAGPRDPVLDAMQGLGDAAANLVEVTGVIKWFDASKGYGFIVPDNGWPDVLLHVTVLRRDGFQTAYEGARIVCECVQRAKGYQAFRIVSMDESTAIHPAQMLPPRTHVSVTATSGLERAQVKWFNRLRGFGFLTCGEGTPDIFVHMETLRRYGMTELRPGQYVLVRFGPGSKGMMAAEIQPETGSPGLSSH
jgi:CspA family cold shock protein